MEGAAAIDVGDRAIDAALADCRLCPRDCRVDRRRSADGAWCRLDARGWIYKDLLSLGEEDAISPTWLVDLGGCSLRCAFCTEWDHVVDPTRDARALDPTWFAARHAAMVARGARTVSLVGGDPTPSAPALLTALAQVEAPLPVVWNCNGLVSPQAWALLGPAVTTWSIDAKFGDPACARRLGGGGRLDVLAAVDDAIATALAVAAPSPLPAVIVRHLAMPGHFACCTWPVLRRLARLFAGVEGGRARVNLMTMYVPALRGAAPRQWNGGAEVARAVAAAREAVGPWLLVDGRGVG